MNLHFIYPMFAMVLLTLITGAIMFRRRLLAVSQGQVKVAHFKTYDLERTPPLVAQAERHYMNLFELPVLFYVGCLAAMWVPTQSGPLAVIAWGFVLARLAHAYIHLYSNKLRPRMAAFFSSYLCVLAFWIFLVIEVFKHSHS